MSKSSNSNYILLKSHYFLSYSCFASINPILSLTLRHRGLSNLEISTINLIIPFVVFFTNPLIGYFVDHTRRFRSTFNLILGFATLLVLGMFFLPSIQTFDIDGELYEIETNNYSLNFCADEHFVVKCSLRSSCGCVYQAVCTSMRTNADQMKENLNLNFTMNENDLIKEVKNNSLCRIRYHVLIEKPNLSQKFTYFTCQIKCSVDNLCGGLRHPNELNKVLVYSLLIIISMSFFANTSAIGTSLGFSVLHQSNMFGRQRLWGTVGYGLTAFVTSRLYAYFQSNYVYIFGFSLTSILCMIVTCLIRSEQKDIPMEKIEFDQLLPLLNEFEVIVFLLTTFLWGMSFSAIDPYLLLYVDEISPCESHSIAGYVSLITSTFEIFALCISDRFLRFVGIQLSTILIFLAFIIRFSGYYFVSRPYLFLPFETLHFFNFGILFVLIAQEAFTIAPPKFAGTLQGIVHGISFGFGRGIGLLVSLFIYTRKQKSQLFLFYAVLNLIGVGLYLIYCLIIKFRSKKSAENV